MFVARATKKLLSLLGPPNLGAAEESTTLLGDGYGTAVFWRPQVALFVNKRTLLPVLISLAPAATPLARFPDQLAAVLGAHGVPAAVIAAELEQMRQRRLAPTASRSVVWSMNEFTCLADAYRGVGASPDLLGLSLHLATVPCGPLYSRHVSPDRELAALVSSMA